ncbi:microtubule-binding stalk of dynein motor-domain-containing protein, partial [Baffinella frigidus]
VLCFSPEGGILRQRCREFPALLSSTVLDFFDAWHPDALVAVATSYLSDFPVATGEKESMAQHMAFVHGTVQAAGELLYETEGRKHYAPPKSFLDFISLFISMYRERSAHFAEMRRRLSNGLAKLHAASRQVLDLQRKLSIEIQEVEVKSKNTDRVMSLVSAETAAADTERHAAAGDEAKCAVIQSEVNRFRAECDLELKVAEPVIAEAEAALQTIDKKALTEMKALTSPPAGLEDVTAGVMVLLSKGLIPKDLSWNGTKKMMGNVDNFLKQLINFDKNNTPEEACAYIEQHLMSKESFNPERMRSKSQAAAGMCAWVINIVKYFRMYQDVRPKRLRMEEADQRLQNANDSMAAVRDRLIELDDRINEYTNQYQTAQKERNDAQTQVDKTRQRAGMAGRLIESLSAEHERWTTQIASIGTQARTACENCLRGDVLVASAFVSYIGAFDGNTRVSLVNRHWTPDLAERSQYC